MSLVTDAEEEEDFRSFFMRLDVDLIIFPAERRGENFFLLLLWFRSATLRMIAISFGEIVPLAMERGDR